MTEIEEMGNESGLEYREIGSGPLMVLLHGFGGNPKQWDSVAEAMSKKYRILIPNLSKIFVDKKSFKDHAMHLKNFLDVQRVGQSIHLVGNSYGGALAWAYTILEPSAVHSLTLLSPMPPHPRSRFRSAVLRNTLAIGRWPILLYLYFRLPFGTERLLKLKEIFQVPWLDRKRLFKGRPTSRQLKLLIHVIHRFSHLISTEDWGYWESRLSFIEQPVCLIWGENDSLYRDDEPKKLLRILKQAQNHHLEETGHFSMQENPLPVIYLMDQFLGRFDFRELVKSG